MILILVDNNRKRQLPVHIFSFPAYHKPEKRKTLPVKSACFEQILQLDATMLSGFVGIFQQETAVVSRILLLTG